MQKYWCKIIDHGNAKEDICASFDGNLIYNKINILGRKNAAITYNSSENETVCFCKIL